MQAAPEDAQLTGALGFIEANLGEKEEALRLGRRAIELLPLDQDALNGMRLRFNLACIYSLIGQKDEAFAELTLWMKNPYHPSYGSFRCHPKYETFRSDPRFQELVASLAPKK